MSKRIIFIGLSLLLFAGFAMANETINRKLGDAAVSYDEDVLTVTTGKVKRTWQLTETGFQTVSYKSLESGKECRITSYNVCYTKLLRCKILLTLSFLPFVAL